VGSSGTTWLGSIWASHTSLSEMFMLTLFYCFRDWLCGNDISAPKLPNELANSPVLADTMDDQSIAALANDA
jgi:hypothetical protein